MKKIYITIIIFVAFMMAGCNNFLEDPQPQQALPLAPETFNTPQAIQSALIGAYNRFQNPNLYGGDFILAADLMSNNISWVGSFAGPNQIASLQMNPNTGNVAGMYTELYQLINDVNGILQFVDGIAGLSDADKSRIKGEAYFLRGAAYFEAIRYFGKPYGPTSNTDMGLVIQPNFIDDLTEINALPRNTVTQVYAQAIDDLTQASTLLSAEFSLNGRANRFAAISFLAEIAFQQGKYAEAAMLANQVIISNNYSLNATVDAFYANEFSGESIMEINMTDQDNPGVNAGLSTFYANNRLGGRQDILIDSNLIVNGYQKIITASQKTALTTANLTATDARVSTLTSGNFTLKYSDGVNNADNIIVFRYAEILLMRAEALARTNGVNSESINLLNQIRSRAISIKDATGNSASNAIIQFQMADFANAQALIDAIILERRVELAFEGNRFHDLRRLKSTIKGTDATADNIVFPIPQNALDNNSELKQNPGY